MAQDGPVSTPPVGASGPARPARRPVRISHVLVFLGFLLVLAGLTMRTPMGGIARDPRYAVPLLAISVGAFIGWYQVDADHVGRWAGRSTWGRAVAIGQVLLGVILAAVGGLVLMTQGRGVEGVWNGALAALAVLLGVAAVAAPFLVTLVRNLERERIARVRETERADIAAHLHDSVLQTLALIQRRADDPATVVRLARRQERELRSWLYAGQPRRADSLAERITAAVHEVEDDHGIPVDLVVTGDRAVDEAGEALVMAAREAVLNAVRHARPPVSVYAEVGRDQAEVFVRDHGDGFDLAALDAVPADRLGVRESILARMARVGGSARVRRMSDGTEVSLVLPPGIPAVLPDPVEKETLP